MTNGCHYWELRPLADWKSFSVGVAYRGSLGRFDQLGKGTGSWCLHASQWLQSSLAAKHNNRAKTLDWPLPQRIGIYCDYDNGPKNKESFQLPGWSLTVCLFCLFLCLCLFLNWLPVCFRWFVVYWCRSSSSCSRLQNKVQPAACPRLHREYYSSNTTVIVQ